MQDRMNFAALRAGMPHNLADKRTDVACGIEPRVWAFERLGEFGDLALVYFGDVGDIGGPGRDFTSSAMRTFIAGMRDKQLPLLRHQRKALDKAGTACRPRARADLAAAFERQPAPISLAAQGSTQAAVRAMRLETEIRTDPQRRTDRFTENLQRLYQQRASLSWNGEHDVARYTGLQLDTLRDGAGYRCGSKDAEGHCRQTRQGPDA